MSKTTKKPRVSIIIVNWNGGSVFEDCAKSLKKIDYPKWELIVVDNGSKDGSEKFAYFAKSSKKQVKIIRNKSNKGFAEANNQGYNVAKGELILLLNNDTRVTKDFLSVMVKYLDDHPEVGVVQPKLEMMDKRGYLDNAGSFMTWTGFLEHWGFNRKDGKEFSKSREIYSAKGACMLIRREVIQKVKLFDKSFKSYFEESDFCMRVWLAGWKISFVPDSKIYHKVGYTSERLQTIDVNYHSIKNRIAALYKNLELTYLIPILSIHTVISFGLVIYYLLRLQFAKVGMFLNAYWWNITNISQLSKKRKFVQSKRTVSDREIFKTNMHRFDVKKMINHFIHVEKDIASKVENSYPQDIPIAGRVRVCLEYVKNAKPRNKVLLNIGSSFGWMEKELTSLHPKEVIGIDPNEKAIEFAKVNVPQAKFRVGSAADISLANSSVDIVTLFDVIEHVPANTEEKVFNEIRRVLKKRGSLLLSTPNSHVVTNLLDPAWYLGHRHYNPDTLVSMLENVGFKVEKVEKRGTVWFSLFLIWLYIMKWIFRQKNPQFKYLEERDNKSFNGSGYHTLFIKATKI